MTEERLLACAREYKTKLGLDSWAIDIVFVDDAKTMEALASAGAIGMSNKHDHYEAATIYLLLAKERDSGDIDANIEHTLAHEMAHVLLGSLVAMALETLGEQAATFKASLQTELEVICNRIATVLTGQRPRMTRPDVPEKPCRTVAL